MNDRREALKGRYWTDGFVRCEGLFDPRLLAEADLEFDRLLTSGRHPLLKVIDKSEDATLPIQDRLVRIENPQVDSTIFDRLMSAPLLGELVAYICDSREVQIFFAHATSLPPNSGESVKIGWHQEEQYPDFISGSFPTVWVPFGDVSEDSGPLRYVKGSHLSVVFPDRGITSPLTHDEQRREIMPGLGLAEWDEVAMTGNAGFCSFHHSRTVHGTAANRSSRPRRAMVMHLRTERNDFSGSANPLYDQYARRFAQDPIMCPRIYPAPDAHRPGEGPCGDLVPLVS